MVVVVRYCCCHWTIFLRPDALQQVLLLMKVMAVALLVLAGGDELLLVSRGRGLGTYAYPPYCLHGAVLRRARALPIAASPNAPASGRPKASRTATMGLVQRVAVLCRTPATSMPKHKKNIRISDPISSWEFPGIP